MTRSTKPAGAGPSQAPEGSDSPLADAVARVGDRWTLLLVEALLNGPCRFNELSERLAGIAPNILSQRLRHLEREALVVTHPYSERPRRLSYELSQSGRELGGALRLLADWGAKHSEDADAPRHAACGTTLQARWWCPTCEQPVDEDDAAELDFV